MVKRKGLTIVEIIVTAVLISACLAPMLANIGRQNVQARWARDRLIAEQLANDVLEHLLHQGYNWMQGAGPAPNAWLGPFATNGLAAVAGDFRVMDTVVGTENYVKAGYTNSINHASPNAINPALSGPDTPGTPTSGWNISSGLSLDGAAQNNARDTFVRLGFQRRVEIFGGPSYTPPGLDPVPMPFPPPTLITSISCFMVRVTVWTPDGTMQAPNATNPDGRYRPDGRYQVVTFIGVR